ncbi:MAG: septal ring lytic transglycosylase RlpA family protein [Vampirovibrio sp.]
MKSHPASSAPVVQKQVPKAKVPYHKVSYLAPQVSSSSTTRSSKSSEPSSNSSLEEGGDSFSSSGASATSLWGNVTPIFKSEKNALFTGDFSHGPNDEASNEIEEDSNKVPSDALVSEGEGPVNETEEVEEGEAVEGTFAEGEGDDPDTQVRLDSTPAWGGAEEGEGAGDLNDQQGDPMPTETLGTTETPNAFPPAKISSGSKGTGSATGAIGPSTGTAAPSTGGKLIESGIASWYGPGFHGRTTASGKKFDQNAMTVAHKSLPFGTKLRVESNGKSVIVTVNDRGPFVKGRVIDLSKAAARQLGIDKSGTAQVKIYKA